MVIYLDLYILSPEIYMLKVLKNLMSSPEESSIKHLIGVALVPIHLLSIMYQLQW